MLLTTQDDKYSRELPKRVDAFLGWIRAPAGPEFGKGVADVYRKRGALVHDGKGDDITVRDLLFTDDLIFNILCNLMRHPRLFKSKEDVLDFSKKTEAEDILGMKPTIRPKSFRVLSRTYRPEDYESI